MKTVDYAVIEDLFSKGIPKEIPENNHFRRLKSFEDLKDLRDILIHASFQDLILLSIKEADISEDRIAIKTGKVVHFIYGKGRVSRFYYPLRNYTMSTPNTNERTRLTFERQSFESACSLPLYSVRP
jgi:hypothetical protein